ncbi:MAG: hypothetical protein GHCLOJNM_00276 [bacterium]|nr:hypothetical protein [bacterium]
MAARESSARFGKDVSVGLLGQWTFEPVAPPWVLLAVLGFGAGIAWFQYLRREVYGVKALIMKALFGVKVAIFLVFTILLAGPQWTREAKQERPPRMVVLFDVSESMNSAEGPDQPTAFVKLRDAFLRRLYPLWQDRFQFRFYSFSSQLVSTDVERLREMTNVVGAASDLRGPVMEAISQQGANPPAAILMLTDGNHNWGPEPTSDIFRTEEDTPIPLIAVSTPSFGELRKSLAIHQVTLPSPTFAREPVEIRFQVAASGAENQEGETKMKIEYNSEGDVWEPMENGEASKPFTLLGSTNLASFGTQFPRGGRYRIQLEASAPGVESASVVHEVEVEPGRWKVALFAGVAGWRAGSLTRRIAYVPRYSLQAAISTRGGSWVFLAAGLGEEDRKLEQTHLLSLEGVASEADLYIFSGLSPAQYQLLPAGMIKERVEKGAAVLLVAGEEEPPQPSVLEAMGLSSVFAADFSNAFLSPAAREVSLTEAAAKHRATKSQTLIAAAKSLPVTLQSFGGIQPAPDSEVLIRFLGGEPCLVARTAGLNRSAFVGGSDLWRWQFQPGEESRRLYEAFNALADNLIRWLVAGEEEEKGKPVLILSQSRVPLGKSVDIGVQYAGATDSATASIHLTVTDPNRITTPLFVHSQPGGFFTAEYTPSDAGQYLFSVQDPSIPGATDEAEISVEPFSIETAISGANEDLLKTLAANTKGAWVDADRIADLDGLKQLEPIFEPRVTYRVLTEPLMSAPWFLLILVLLFGIEWFLRRTHDLP